MKRASLFKKSWTTTSHVPKKDVSPARKTITSKASFSLVLGFLLLSIALELESQKGSLASIIIMCSVWTEFPCLCQHEFESETLKRMPKLCVSEVFYDQNEE